MQPALVYGIIAETYIRNGAIIRPTEFSADTNGRDPPPVRAGGAVRPRTARRSRSSNGTSTKVDPIPRRGSHSRRSQCRQRGSFRRVRVRRATEPQDLPLPPTSLCCAVGASSAAVGSARPVNPVPSGVGHIGGTHTRPHFASRTSPKTGGRRSSPARARTMAGRDAAAFIRRRRLIMNLTSPRTGTERTCHPAPQDSRTRRRSTFPTFPASGPRRTAAPPPNHCSRRTRHLSAPWLHGRHLAVPAHLPSSAPSSRQPLTFAQTPRTIRSIL